MSGPDYNSGDEQMLRGIILDLLHYPRQIFQDDQDLDDCPHGGFYNENEKDCELCEQLSRCRWLLSNDEFVDLKQKTTEQLLDALRFARDQICMNVLTVPHRNTCKCEICSWLVIADVCLVDTASRH